MELKCGHGVNFEQRTNGSNRTFMELKFLQYSIVPT